MNKLIRPDGRTPIKPNFIRCRSPGGLTPAAEARLIRRGIRSDNRAHLLATRDKGDAGYVRYTPVPARLVLTYLSKNSPGPFRTEDGGSAARADRP